MFKTQHVETYLQDAYPGLDGDKRLMILRCYVNPITRDRALEVGEELAELLFKKQGSEWLPRTIMAGCKFASNLPPYSLSFCRHPDYAGDRVFVRAVKISKIEAGKVTPESNDWALMFNVSFEVDDPSITKDLFQLFHEKFYLTFGELQPGLFDGQDPVMDLLCRLCDAPNPEFATTDGKFAYCAKHASNTQEGEQLRRIRNHEAAAEVMREPGDESENEEPRKDPLEADFNARNQQSRRTRRVKHVR